MKFVLPEIIVPAVRLLQRQPKSRVVLDSTRMKAVLHVPLVQLVPIPLVGREEIPLPAINVRKERTSQIQILLRVVRIVIYILIY